MRRGAVPVAFAKLDGTGGDDLNPGTATVSEAYGVAVDPTAGKAYWADRTGNKISFARLDKSGGADLKTGTATVDYPIGIAIDPGAGKLYWVNGASTKLSFASLDNSGIGGDVKSDDAIVAGPVFPLLLEVPRPRGAPVVTGGSVVGKRLTCSRGIWAGDIGAAFLYRAPQSLAYRWSRDGKLIPGATTSSYKAAAAGVYSCRVSATNAAGTATQTSRPHKVFATVAITKAKVNSAKSGAKFSFRSSGGANGFQCALIKRKHGKKGKKPSFSACESPKTYKELKPGKYTFEVRALSAAGAGPATKKSFTI